MNNMTRDPNQESRPSVFGFDPYPSSNTQPIDWGRIPMEPPPNAINPPGQFNPALNYQAPQVGLGNFNFCTTQTPHPAQFPFPLSDSNSKNDFFTIPPLTRCKRKTDSPPLQASKQHITEEKMAEHMSRLHISSEMASSSKETDSERTQRLYMCEEMRKLQSDSILPHSLLSGIHRPCTALVLWQPPRRLIPVEDNGNNNEESMPDHNRANEVVMENDLNNMDMDNI